MPSWYGGILPGFREPKTTRVADIAVDDKPICVMAFGRNVYEYNGRILTDRPKLIFALIKHPMKIIFIEAEKIYKNIKDL